MQKKDRLRKKYLFLRKKKYFDIKPSFFDPLINLIGKRFNKNIIISSYYPASYEVNTLELFEKDLIKNCKILLPTLKKKNTMYFQEWKKNDILKINKFGMLEPAVSTARVVPDIMLIPLLAYDDNYNRLGYGGGFYDRYLNKYLKKYKKILRIGIAFSFQKHHKIPTSNKDVKLNFVLTERGLS